MGTICFLADNFMTASTMLSLSNVGTGGTFGQAGNRLTGIIPSKVGYATLETQGAYTGLLDKDFVVHIHAPADAGAPYGRWRWSNTGGASWNATDLVAVAETWVLLSDGVQVRFHLAPITPQLVVGDVWQFRATCPEGVATLIDLVRNTAFRSTAVSVGMQAAFVADLGSARTPSACAILDHNLLAGTTVQLWGSAAANLTPHETYAMTYQAGRMCSLPTVTPARRYWALVIVVQGGQPAIQLSEWYLGAKTVLSEPYSVGFQRGRQRVAGTDPAVLRYGPGPATPYSEIRRLTFGDRQDITGGDAALLEAIWQQLNVWQTQDLRPVYVVPDDATPNTFGLYHWPNDYDTTHTMRERYNVTVELLEVIRTVA